MGALAFGAACHNASNEDETVEPMPPTTLTVKNQAFLDMNVFVYRSTQRMRLGTATGSNTTKFTIPPTLLFGTTALRFQAVPIGGNRQSVSQEISVTPGDDIDLMIPP
ncbi:MAG: hypothetical protein JWM95_4237 [Gemmatimonadetes bacterium]|nr:hypothetical protein [Gemmatimonadota bacterium]